MLKKRGERAKKPLTILIVRIVSIVGASPHPTFYARNQPSNQVNVDVVGYCGSYMSGNVPQAWQPSRGQILIDSQDEGFNPDAEPEGYGDPYLEPGTILIDSVSQGFDPMAPVRGEAI